MDRQIENKKWNFKRILTLCAAGILFLTGAYFLLGDRSSKLNVPKDRITICEVRQAAFQEFIAVTGTIEPFKTIYLDLSEGGRIAQKFVQEGAVLKAGDPVITLENQNLALQMMNTQSNLMLAESQMRQTGFTFEQNRLNKENQLLDVNAKLLEKKRNFDVNNNLYQKGLVSKNEYEASKEQYEYFAKSRALMLEVLKKDSLTNENLNRQNEEVVGNSKKYLSLVQSQMENLTVKAPISGQLTSLSAEIGQSVGAGYKLGQIDNTDSYKIRAEIDEHYISKIREGLEGEYEFNSKTYKLAIKTVFPQITNGRFFVDMVFCSGQPEGIRRGQTVHLRLQIGGISNALLVENSEFFSTTGGQWIFVLDKSESYAERRAIKTGRQNPEFFEILGGLKPGEKVITSSYEDYINYSKLILK